MTTPSGGDPAGARLLALAEVAAVLGTSIEIDAMAALAVQVATRLAGDAATIAAYSVQTGELEVLATGHPPAQVPELLEHGARTMQSGGGLDGRLGSRPVAVLPIRARGRLLGCMVVTSAQDAGIDMDAITFAQALADLLGAKFIGAQMRIDLQSAHEEVRRQSEMLEHVSDAIIAVDAECMIMNWNAAAERIYGYSGGEALGCDLFALLDTHWVTEDGSEVSREAVLAQLRETRDWRGEVRERGLEGQPLEILSSIAALPDGGLVIVNRDVTEQRHKEHLATHDILTGLPNRMLMAQSLRRALDDSRRNGTTVGVGFIDLNGFKAINDGLGHDAGDEVLRVTAQRLAEVMRPADVVARLGGDEFVVIAIDITDEDARALGRRLVERTSQPIALGEHRVKVSSSLGIALSRPDETDPDELLRLADAAMYEAKQNRRGVVFAEPTVRSQ